MPEKWLPVPGFDYYEVSNLGRVRTKLRPVNRGSGVWMKPPQVLRPGATLDGRLFVHLRKDGESHLRRIHRLVLEAFVGPCPDGMEGCHNNGDHTDNRIENLRWDTHSANIQDCLRHGTHKYAAQTHCKRGHELTPENCYGYPKRRQCKVCTKAHANNSYAKRKVSA